MKTAAFADVKDRLSKFLREAEHEQVVITRHGRPAGVLIGFETEDDWFEYKMENDPRFLRRIAEARADLRAGKSFSWNEMQKDEDLRIATTSARRETRRP